MKIIILSQWYPPEPETRIHMLALGLKKSKYDVLVVTGYPNYPEGKLYPGYKIKFFERDRIDGINIIRTALYPDHSKSKIKRIINYLSFAITATLVGLKFAVDADILWVYHPPLTISIPAIIISKIRKIPYVYEIQDLWPETLNVLKIVKNKNILKLLDIIANYIYNNACKISVISNGFKNVLIKKGIKEKKIEVIPNWTNEEIYIPQKPLDLIREKYKFSKIYNVVYAGNIGSAQGLNNVIEAAILLKQHIDILITIIGEGIEKEKLNKRISLEKLNNIRILDRLDNKEIVKIFAIADVLLIHLINNELFKITIPGKTTAYLACGKPIICCVGGEVNKIIEDAECGIAIDPENPKMLSQAIINMKNLCKKEKLIMGEKAYAYYKKYFSKNVLIQKYINIFDEVGKNERYEQ